VCNLQLIVVDNMHSIGTDDDEDKLSSASWQVQFKVQQSFKVDISVLRYLGEYRLRWKGRLKEIGF